MITVKGERLQRYIKNNIDIFKKSAGHLAPGIIDIQITYKYFTLINFSPFSKS